MFMPFFWFLVCFIAVAGSDFANASGVTFAECQEALCEKKEPNYPALETHFVISRIDCLARCLGNDLCNFVGHYANLCKFFTTPNLANDMRHSTTEWKFWIRPNLCDSNPCLNFSTCQQRRDFYKCLCGIQYGGTRCEEKVSCTSAPCHNNASCVVMTGDGDFECICLTGYTGELCESTI
ncbi:sushi, nidogen and EGF-like domain-containing protein 1 [Saccostrea echinata]|uniref:sushi, nidogen and EGF-like domain-containing protein 1 n=1 Tax=Saccostrea echinata TaxID=191078 RepID=UPI002A8106EE|nr:sushi, nidogen and EGF-like domain-containing protein 1 [Saccostrea echinata]